MTKMNLLQSSHGNIHFGTLQQGLKQIIDELQPSSVFCLTDTNTFQYCLPTVHNVIKYNHSITISPGEQSKDLTSCETIWTELTNHGADRSSLLLNIGGGMICDLGGFAASCYQRGIRFGHIPTSLLAMADGAIGGKTGVNFKGYKNYIGQFRDPAFIWMDPVFLQTLPPKEWTGGLAEMIKHAIIGSHHLWNYITQIQKFNLASWEKMLELNAQIKNQIVEADPYESGLRKVLNFGHTIGHALESHFLHTAHPISHGEAVTLGMLCESRIAQRMGFLQEPDFIEIMKVIYGLLRPVEVPLPSVKELIPWISGDKKKMKGRVGFSLPDRIGSCGWNIAVENQVLEESFQWLVEQVSGTGKRLNGM